jgi:Fe-S-cluster containining protein
MIPVEPVEQEVIMSLGAFQHSTNMNVACSDRVLPLNAQGNKCGYLDPFKRCAVYENRPMICRFYGAAEGLECEHGCKPKRYLNRDQVVKLMRKVQKI